jgi:aminoglycoside phosphotransferase (APT) family kinase protein
MDAANRAGVTVPTVHELVVIDGRPGLVMDRVDGTDLLTTIARRPWTFARSARALGRLEARLHDVVAPPSLPDLRERLDQRIETAPHLSPRLRADARRLLAGLPDGDRVCHGDLHPGNVILDANGPVLIDWTNAARGDPTADLARTVLMLRVGPLPEDVSTLARVSDRVGRTLFRRVWVRSYRRVRPFDDVLLERWETVGAAARLAEGIGEEVAPLLALLEARTWDPRHP